MLAVVVVASFEKVVESMLGTLDTDEVGSMVAVVEVGDKQQLVVESTDWRP